MFLDNPRTFDIWDTDNWEPEFMTIFVISHLIVTLDSIRNSCDVFKNTSKSGEIKLFVILRAFVENGPSRRTFVENSPSWRAFVENRSS